MEAFAAVPEMESKTRVVTAIFAKLIHIKSTKNGPKCKDCKKKYDLIDDGDLLRCWFCGNVS